MRTRLLVPLLLALLVPVPVAAQSGTDGVSGLVLPEHPDHPGTPQRWERAGRADSTDHAASPTVTLIPLATHLPAETRRQRMHGADGRYAFGPVPMGLYRLRVEAPGYAPWEAEVYVPSDTEARVYVLLHPEEPRRRTGATGGG